MNLLSVAALGGLYTALMLLFSIIVIHGYKLAKIGYRTVKKKLPPDPPKPQKKKPEPVYYSVEKKKKKRTKAEYDNPKEIKFR